MMALKLKPVIWIANTKKVLSGFPEDVRDAMGFALFAAQKGGKHPDAKPLLGFGGAEPPAVVETPS